MASTIKTIQNATGVSWLSVVVGLFALAFFFYIAANGSLSKYKELLL